MPDLYIIAGPSGAGKTTAATTAFPEILGIIEFVNADEIAKGLSPFNPESVAIQAGRIMLQRIDHLIAARKSFSIETTLTTISYLKTIKFAKFSGYDVTLFYVWLNSAELSKERVRARVLKGGHNIPIDVIERRYGKSTKNLPKFMDVVDDWYIYDNSESYYELIAKFVNDEQTIQNHVVFNKIIQYDN